MTRRSTDSSPLGWARFSAAIGAALFALLLQSPEARAESDDASKPQLPEDRWVASLGITSGVLVQSQDGRGESEIFPGMGPVGMQLRDPVNDDELAVQPFVGGNLELMSPALDIPTRPRFFVSGEFLPTFASERVLAVEGDPSCVRGPEPDAPCAADEPAGVRDRSFTDDQANGTGTKVKSEIAPAVFGASLGAAFPVTVKQRHVRIKPSVSWINYKVKADGLVVDADCPTNNCTDVTRVFGDFTIVTPGVLREARIESSGAKHFNAIGPGLDVEVDVGRFGPVGAALLAGGRAYRNIGSRKLKFSTTQDYEDAVGDDTIDGRFQVKVDQWMYRAHVGVRFQWLGER